MVTAKGIGSCYAPLAAVTVSDEVNDAFADGGHFTHGYTYSGHAVACAVGLEVIDIIEKGRAGGALGGGRGIHA